MKPVAIGLFVICLYAVSNAQTPTPYWIWHTGRTTDAQTLHARRVFTLEVKADQIKNLKANFWGSCDNEFTAYLNNHTIGTSKDWNHPMSTEAGGFLRPGKNVLSIQARNHGGSAGLIVRLSITLPDGKVQTIITDDSWRTTNVRPTDNTFQNPDFDESDWRIAKVLGKLGIAPWGTLVPGQGKSITATPAETLEVLPGFKAELVYSVPKAVQGSWVSMTNDPKGRLYVSDQGGPLYRVTPGKTIEETKVENVELPVGHAQGMCWAYDSLYIVINGSMGKNGPGLYRLTDTNNDDKLDKVEQIVKLSGGGEHGPHAVVLGPDHLLYISGGNFSRIPIDKLAPDSPHRNFAEDLLLPRNPDGGGHDPNVMAPGGWIMRCDKEGNGLQLFCAGNRNHYDIAFNSFGDIFLYDSDMEWDVGSPWYRPTRVVMAQSGGEYGWRNGTGKWPEYYPDSLPATVNTGLGSPTGVTFGYGAKFPAKYQHAFFICDWAYGKLYAAHINPRGGGYDATFEPFVQGKGWDVTDIVINHDGQMYITIGGRGTQSGLYRISYAGNEPTTPVTPVSDPQSARAREIRRSLEKFHGRQDPAAVSTALPNLNNPDRFIRYAARIALEFQPVNQWKEQVLAEKRPTALINGALGLIRAGAIAPPKLLTNAAQTTEYQIEDPNLQKRILTALDRLNPKALSEDQLLELTRVYAVCFIRMGKPDEAFARALASKFDAVFPNPSTNVNREVAQLLVYLQSPTVVAKTMKLLAGSSIQEDQLHYAFILRGLPSTAGWSIEQRKAYFSWIGHASANYRGGSSFKKFLARIKEDAIKTLAPEELAAVKPILEGQAMVKNVVLNASPKRFVRNWQMQDLANDYDKLARGRSFAKGKEAYETAQCAACHRFGQEGGATGPDLTGVGNRFAAPDVLEAIILPSKVISDQYQTTVVDTVDDDIVTGRVVYEDDKKIEIATNPFSSDTQSLEKKEIKTRGFSKLSMMPNGLIDTLTRDEILDLIAYIRSGGNEKDPTFAK